MRTIAVYACLASFGLISIAARAQDAAPAQKSPYESVIGTVAKIDDGAKTFTIKTDKGAEAPVKFDDKTSFLRIPAGETDIRKATKVAASDVGTGDRILARVRTSDPTGLPAVTFIITKQADIAQRQEKTREEWQTQGVSGAVKAIDPAAKKITISVRGAFGPPRDVLLDVDGTSDFQRYNPDSGKYEPSNMAAIQTGDQVRVLGQKNADQSQIKVEAIMSGAFKSVPVQIKSIDAAENQIVATDLATKKPITIKVRPDTTMKKLDDETALMLARRLNPTFQGGGKGRGQGAARADAGGGRPAGFGGQGRAGGGRALDPSKLLEQQATIQLADLKPGEPIVVTGSTSSDPSKLTAMTLVAGVDPILRAAPQNGPDPLGGNWNFGDIGGAPVP